MNSVRRKISRKDEDNASKDHNLNYQEKSATEKTVKQAKSRTLQKYPAYQ